MLRTRTKYFEINDGIYYDENNKRIDNANLDDLINNFIKTTDIFDLIDIKYQSNVAAVADSGISATYTHASALIIYVPNL